MVAQQSFLGDLFAISTALAWSIGVIVFRKAGFQLGTIPSKSLQNGLATLFFFCTILLFDFPIFLNLDWQEWGLLFASAVLGITIGDTLFIAALNRIGASSQAIVDGLYSPLLALTGYFIFKETLSLYEVLGGFFVIFGVILGAQKSTQNVEITSKQKWEGYLLGILAQVVLVVTVALIRDLIKDHSIMTLSAYRFLIGTICYWILFSLTKHRKEIFSGYQWNATFRLNLAGTLVGPFLATILWFLGFKYSPLARAGIYNQLSTIFIIMLAAFFLKERLNRPQIIAVLFSIVGVFLVSL